MPKFKKANFLPHSPGPSKRNAQAWEFNATEAP